MLSLTFLQKNSPWSLLYTPFSISLLSTPIPDLLVRKQLPVLTQLSIPAPEFAVQTLCSKYSRLCLVEPTYLSQPPPPTPHTHTQERPIYAFPVNLNYFNFQDCCLCCQFQSLFWSSFCIALSLSAVHREEASTQPTSWRKGSENM